MAADDDDHPLPPSTASVSPASIDVRRQFRKLASAVPTSAPSSTAAEAARRGRRRAVYIKKNDHIGELNHNVNFRTKSNKAGLNDDEMGTDRSGKTMIKRALVIRVSFLKELMIL